MWVQLHARFTEPEVIEIGSFIGYIAGRQRWITALSIGHGEVLTRTAGGLSPKAVNKITEKMEAEA